MGPRRLSIWCHAPATASSTPHPTPAAATQPSKPPASTCSPPATPETPQSSTESSPPERGPAYDSQAHSSKLEAHSSDWPTYRSNGERSGSTKTTVPASLELAWQTKAGDRLSAPTVAEGRVFVADVAGHRVCSFDATSGKPAWQFTAGARIDSPPTVSGGRALFGSRDGYVYSVTTNNGTLAWRTRAARADRRVAVEEQLESVSPCIGSVLLRDGVIYATAGRNSYMDSGVDICRIDPATGNLLSRSVIYSPVKRRNARRRNTTGT